MIQTENIERVSEKITYTYKGYLNSEHGALANRSWKPKLSIIRHQNDDTFDIEVTSAIIGSGTRECKPYVVIDSKTVVDTDVEYPSAVESEGIKTFKINSHTLKNAKLSKIGDITVAVRNDMDTQFLFNVKVNRFALTKPYANISGGKVFDFYQTKKISFQFRDMATSQTYKYFPKWIDNTFVNGHTYFVPRKMNRRTPNENVMDIYTSMTDMQQALRDNDVDFDKKEVSTLNTSLRTALNTNVNHDEVLRVQNGESQIVAHKLGEIKVIDHTYYDYDKGRIEKGVSPNSQLGEIIPYNFSGNYTTSQNINGYGIMKDFPIINSTNFKTPILNPVLGTVQLKINDTENNDTLPKYELDKDGIDQILAANEVSLDMIKRISDEAVI